MIAAVNWELTFDILTGLFLTLGCFLAFTGSLGVVRMPDFYTRLHPAGKSDTAAQALILIGLMFQAEDHWVVLKLLLITGILLVTAPTATHAITKAAWLDGLIPWEKPGDAEGRIRGQDPDDGTLTDDPEADGEVHGATASDSPTSAGEGRPS